MTTKTSLQLKAETRTNFYGINPVSLLVESVSLTRGGTLVYRQTGKSPSTYRIKGGLPPREEVERVFRLTDIVSLAARADTAPGEADHPFVAALKEKAAFRRDARDARESKQLAAHAASALVTQDRAQFPDHRVLSESEHIAPDPGTHESGTHPLAAFALASAGWNRDGLTVISEKQDDE